MDKTSVEMRLIKETKNTYLYQHDTAKSTGPKAPVTAIYIQKQHTGSNPPKVVRVTVEDTL